MQYHLLKLNSLFLVWLKCGSYNVCDDQFNGNHIQFIIFKLKTSIYFVPLIISQSGISLVISVYFLTSWYLPGKSLTRTAIHLVISGEKNRSLPGTSKRLRRIAYVQVLKKSRKKTKKTNKKNTFTHYLVPSSKNKYLKIKFCIISSLHLHTVNIFISCS